MLHPWPQSAAPLGRRTADVGCVLRTHADNSHGRRGLEQRQGACKARTLRGCPPLAGSRPPNPKSASHGARSDERRATSGERRAASRDSRTPVPESRIPNPEPRFPAVGRRLPFWQFPRPSACPPRFIFQPRQGRLIVATRRKSKIRPSSWWTRGSPADRAPPFSVGAPAGATERRSIAPTGLQTEKRWMNVGTPLPRACAPWLLSIVPSALALESFPQRRMPIRPCKNHQIRVKINQKGDVFRQKGIKKARISSCPS